MDSKYKYTYEKTANYCYEGTDTLINKLNITNDKDLFNAERELVSFRTYELNEKPLKGNFDFDYLNSDKYYEVYLRDEYNTLVSTELEDFEFLERFNHLVYITVEPYFSMEEIEKEMKNYQDTQLYDIFRTEQIVD
jgi:cell filamentation protein